VHLTRAGCLGPCALANVASLVFDGRAVWFHSVNTPWHVRLIFDYIDTMVRADRFVAPPSELAEYVFNYYDWDVRPKAPSAVIVAEPQTSASACIALLSHADTDLLALRRAREVLPADLDVIGISLMRIQTQEQFELLLRGDLAGVHVLAIRLHGELTGLPWFDRLHAWVLERGLHLVVVSGTGEPRADFARISTTSLDVVDAVRLYLTIGGRRNVGECMKFLADRLLLTGYGSVPPIEVGEHGIYLPDVENATLDDWRQRADPSRPTAAILFYRAHYASGNLAFIDQLIDALDERGLNALPVFTSSLRAREDGIPAALILVGDRADVIISTLSFALGNARDGEETPPLERLGVPVVQAITSGMPREAWEVSHRGLTALDTAINVAMPEFDGRIVSVPISFKDRTDNAPGLYAPHIDRIARVAGLASALARLRHRPRADMRVAFVLTDAAKPPGTSSRSSGVGRGVAITARLAPEPAELDARATLVHAVGRPGGSHVQLDDLHERVRAPKGGTRFLFIVDSSGSHAAQERMRFVKGAVSGLLESSPGRRDEVVVISCRGASASVLLEPTSAIVDVQRALEYLPTGGRTPLAHALELASRYVTDATAAVLITDGHANVPTTTDDAWADALDAARALGCPSIVIDSEDERQATGRPRLLAEAMRGTHVRLADLDQAALLRVIRRTP
jgi:Mg-chelatase subunit ChlD